MTGTYKDAYNWAHRQVGYRESGTNHQKFSPEVPGLEWSQNQPWCQTYLSWVLLKAGLSPNKDFPVTASCLAAVSWFKRNNRWGGRTPHVGDMVFYGANGGTHVELVIGVSRSYIRTNGGNTSGSLGGRYFNGDGVYEKTVPRGSSRIYGYGRPRYASGAASSSSALSELPGGVLEQGDTGPDVKAWQENVNYYYKPVPRLTEDGEYGPKTKATTKRVQEKALGFKGRDVDGEYGPKTKAAFKKKYKIS